MGSNRFFSTIKRQGKPFTAAHLYRSALVLFALLAAPALHAATLAYYGPASGPDGTNAWPSTWVSIASLNDGADTGLAGKVDFVGDVQNPGFFVAESPTYLFFRMRVNTANAPLGTFTDAHMVLIDVVGWNYPGTGQEGAPDYALAWDSKSNDPAQHGLEMQIAASTNGPTWGDVRMGDLDNSAGKKVSPPDINTTGDGFVRTVDSQASASLGGNTTFIDFAVSKLYLQAQTPNILTHDLRFQLGSITFATDHNALSADVAGGYSLTSNVTTTWSSTQPAFTVPEPSPCCLLALSLLGLMLAVKRSRLCG